MRLSYRSYRVRLYQGEPYSTVWRPSAPIVLHGPLGSVRLSALVDPGADQTVLPRIFADALGIAADEQRPGSVRGFAGAPITIHPGDAELEIAHQGQRFRWPATVRFGPGNHSVLGHLVCLEFFKATFDYYHRFFELEPNELYPGQS